MPFVIALAVREMGLTPAEALLRGDRGRRACVAARRHRPHRGGVRADLTVLDAPTYLHLSYRPGVPIARALELPAG